MSEKKFAVSPIQIENNKKLKFQKNLFLVYTNISRRANDIANTFINDLYGSKKDYVKKIINHAVIAKKLLKDSRFDDFGLLLSESWDLKKKLSNSVSNSSIDDLYSLALKSGATGGKLLGAGGGGFFLFYVPKRNQEKFKSTFLKKRLQINFNFENLGSHIVRIN